MNDDQSWMRKMARERGEAATWWAERGYVDRARIVARESATYAIEAIGGQFHKPLILISPSEVDG